MDEAEFDAAIRAGLEPAGHLANVRLAWTMHRRHGRDGLRYTEEAIERRASKTGGTWDRALTRAWFERVADLADRGAVSFEEFLDQERSSMLSWSAHADVTLPAA